VEVHQSARKHGIADEDTIHAAEQFVVAYQLETTMALGRSCGSAQTERATCWRWLCCCWTTAANWRFMRCG
jgi:hypothetical protein